MNWRTFSAVTAAMLIVPWGTYVARANPEISEENLTMQLSQMKHDKRGSRGRGMERLMQQLNLTPEQSEQIKAIKEQSKTETQALMQQMQTSRQEMRSLLASDSSPEQLRDRHQAVQNLHQELGTNRFETMLEIREVLTPEQRTQMAELIEQRREKFK
ncbi:MAG TPA: Spy/CpxP family protein refolding chaperone [Coleofasciculaceae cyanobacterium]|jgi:Spy/CpxP family protein refolding chaperone